MRKLKKVLIIRLSSIGDIILTTPLIRVLNKKYPDCKIDFVIKHQFRDLIAAHPAVSRLYVYKKNDERYSLKKIRKLIREERYDIIIDIHKNFRSVYLRTCANAGKVVQFKKYAFKRWLLIKFKLNMYDHIVPVYQRYIDSLKDFDIEYDHKGVDLYIPEHYLNSIDHKWRSIIESIEGPIIGIAPGASYLTKRWMPNGFQNVARRLLQQHGDASIIFFGNTDDRRITDSILAGLQDYSDRIFNMAGELSLMESAALLNYCSYVITNDTGLMHMATGLKKKVVAIFGSTTRELGFFPCSNDAAIVQNVYLRCRPCSHVGRHECPEKHFKCMKDITPDHVIEAFELLR